MGRCERKIERGGFTLLEMLIVMAIIGIFAGMILSNSDMSNYDCLRASGRTVAAELMYGRSLAIANDSLYRFRFELGANRMIMEHSGLNTGLNRLPNSPYANPGDPETQHILDFDELPHIGSPVRLEYVGLGEAKTSTDRFEYSPMGGVVGGEVVTLWLSVGSGEKKRFLSLSVDPIMGLVEVGDYRQDGPPD